MLFELLRFDTEKVSMAPARDPNDKVDEFNEFDKMLQVLPKLTVSRGAGFGQFRSFSCRLPNDKVDEFNEFDRISMSPARESNDPVPITHKSEKSSMTPACIPTDPKNETNKSEKISMKCMKNEMKQVPTSKMKNYKLNPESPSTLAVQHDPWLFFDRVELGRMRATCHRRHELVGEWTPFADFFAEVAETVAKLQSEDEKAEDEVEEHGICFGSESDLFNDVNLSGAGLRRLSFMSKRAEEEEIDDDLDKKIVQPTTTVYVIWQGSSLCADDVVNHMREYGPCTFEDWDVQSLCKKAWNTATIEFTDSHDAQRALSAKHVEIKNDDKQMVPAELSWQLSAETSLS